jgi:hypothetical protein
MVNGIFGPFCDYCQYYRNVGSKAIHNHSVFCKDNWQLCLWRRVNGSQTTVAMLSQKLQTICKDWAQAWINYLAIFINNLMKIVWLGLKQQWSGLHQKSNLPCMTLMRSPSHPVDPTSSTRLLRRMKIRTFRLALLQCPAPSTPPQPPYYGAADPPWRIASMSPSKSCVHRSMNTFRIRILHPRVHVRIRLRIQSSDPSTVI